MIPVGDDYITRGVVRRTRMLSRCIRRVKDAHCGVFQLSYCATVTPMIDQCLSTKMIQTNNQLQNYDIEANAISHLKETIILTRFRFIDLENTIAYRRNASVLLINNYNAC